MAKWFAGAVIHRLYEEDVVQFLVMDCTSVDPKYKGSPMQTKFPGGTEEDHPEDRHVLDTLRRELAEETGLYLPEGIHPMLICSETRPGHFKNFYLISFHDLLGELRRKPLVVGNDEMSEPYWIDFHTACRLLFHTHQSALLKAFEKLQKVG